MIRSTLLHNLKTLFSLPCSTIYHLLFVFIFGKRTDDATTEHVLMNHASLNSSTFLPSSSVSPDPTAGSSHVAAEPLQQYTEFEQRDIPSIGMVHDGPHGTSSARGDHALIVHQLRSTQYRHEEQYVRRRAELLKAFNSAYARFETHSNGYVSETRRIRIEFRRILSPRH